MSTFFQEERPAISGGAERAPIRLTFSRWMVVLLAMAVVSPWLVIASVLASGHALSENSKASLLATTSPSANVAGGNLSLEDDALSESTPAELPQKTWIAGKKGPWGQIDTMLFAIDVPEEFLFVPPADQPPVRWAFPGYTQEKVLAMFRSVGMPESEVAKLNRSAKWSNDDGVTSVEPGDPLILGLAADVRAKLYPILVAFPQNARHIDPIWFRPGMIDWRLQDSGLASQSIALLKRLLYPQGDNMFLLADFEPALRSLPSDAERRCFMKAVSRKQAVMARLRLDPETDVEKISQYWGIGGRRKDLFPFLGALHRVEKGCRPNVIYLLPDFARDRLYCHPFTSVSEKGVKQDCFWSAFNFFNDPPDNRFNDMEYVRQVLDREYYEVQEPSQLGDLVFLAVGKTVIHAAAYVADDLVFTKNGEDFRQPWILMHMADMMDTYAVKYPNSGTLKPQFYRKKSL